MLSWKKLNASIIWLRNFVLTPMGTAWDRARQWPVSSIVGVASVIFVIYFFKTPIYNTLNHAEDGKIIVNSPTVYTRQRLVNDRLDQARWLRTQLEFTEKEREKDFKSIDQLNNVYTSAQATFGDGASEKEKKADNRTPGSISVEATTTAQFRAKNTYREEVRSEITQTELDDRHDIRGNTIFRLAFDATILAGTRRDSVAGISIKLSHHPESATGSTQIVYSDDYRSLYEDWARYFQDTIRKSLSIVPQSIMSPDPIPQLRILFTEFLLRRICQFSNNDPDLTKDPAPCEEGERKSAQALLADYSKERFKTLESFRLDGFVRAVAGYAGVGYSLPPGNRLWPEAAAASPDPSGSGTAVAGHPPTAAVAPAPSLPASSLSTKEAAKNGLAQLISTATRACTDQQKVEIALWELKIVPPQSGVDTMSSNQQGQQPSSANSAARSDPRAKSGQARPNGQTMVQSGAMQPNPAQSSMSDDRIGCPFYDSLSERLISGVLLYENLLSLATLTESERIKDADVRRDRVMQELKSCEGGACQVSPARLRCFSADFIKSNLNAFEKDVDETQKIKHYLDLQIVGRDVNDCNILVSAYEKENIGSDKKPYSPLAKFIESLNRGTDAFAYSVTPKNLTENISTAAETRDAFELMFRTASDNRQIADLLRQRAEQNQAIVAHPIVVGFGTPGDAKMLVGTGNQPTSGIRDIDFGWIVAPRSRVTGDFEQIDGQYPLTAFISVPAWWRTVEVDMGVCWLSRASLVELRAAADICPDAQRKRPNSITVRLPSAIPEISRKLGFDVVQQPSLYEPRQKELVVGTPGALLLEGARLWRSTEVTAGSQRAEKISVLPNMEGILAEFKCVLPPAGQRQTRQNTQVGDDRTQIITMDWVRVWTSEGVTEPIPLAFVWRDDWESLLANCQNPQPSQTAAQATSTAAAQNAKQNPPTNVPDPAIAAETKAPEIAVQPQGGAPTPPLASSSSKPLPSP